MKQLAMILLIAASSCKDDRAPPAPVQTPTPAAAPGPLPHNQPIDVKGITVRFLDDDTVELSGADRWGGRIDTKYENVEFFRKALPVLERSLTEDQIVGLRTLATSIGP